MTWAICIFLGIVSFWFTSRLFQIWVWGLMSQGYRQAIDGMETLIKRGKIVDGRHLVDGKAIIEGLRKAELEARNEFYVDVWFGWRKKKKEEL